LCADLTGPSAVYWDLGNGIFQPLNFVPVPGGDWPRYIHPTYPALGFQHPPNWPPTTSPGTQTVGVDLIRSDTQGAWRYSTVFGSPIQDAKTHRDAEIEGLKALFELTGEAKSVCSNSAQTTPALGITSRASSILADAGNMRMQVVVQTIVVDGLPGASVSFQVSAAAADDFDREIVDTFLPIYFQLLVGKESVQDTDGDGEPDATDAAPFDPDIQ